MHSVRSIFFAILDTILPPRARTHRLRTLRDEDIALSPRAHTLLGNTVIALTDYTDETVRDLVQSLKYDGGGKAAQLCARALSEYLEEVIEEARLFSQQRVLIMPVPLHVSRMRERGFNQISLVLERLPPDLRDGTRAHLVHDVLVRARATAPQTHLPRAERLSNVAGAFSVAHPDAIRGAHVFLIDDVTTTGATLVNAGNALRRAGGHVQLLALARA